MNEKSINAGPPSGMFTPDEAELVKAALVHRAVHARVFVGTAWLDELVADFAKVRTMTDSSNGASA